MGKSGENEENGENQRDKQRKTKDGAQIKLGGEWNAMHTVHTAHSHVYKQTNMQQEERINNISID